MSENWKRNLYASGDCLRTVEIRFEKNAFDEYKELERKAGENRSSADARIFDAVNRVVDDLEKALKSNTVTRIGRPISVSKLSSKLAKQLKKENVSIIWSVELPDGWRMVYVVSGDEIRIVAFVLNLSDHKNYERFLNQ